MEIYKKRAFSKNGSEEDKLKFRKLWPRGARARLFLAVLFTLVFTISASGKITYDTHHMIDVEVTIASHEFINTIWRITGGQEDWDKVHAFSYYDHNNGKYHIFLPYGASEALIGHEFAHILAWKGADVKEVRAEDELRKKEDGSNLIVTDKVEF